MQCLGSVPSAIVPYQAGAAEGTAWQSAHPCDPAGPRLVTRRPLENAGLHTCAPPPAETTRTRNRTGHQTRHLLRRYTQQRTRAEDTLPPLCHLVSSGSRGVGAPLVGQRNVAFRHCQSLSSGKGGNEYSYNAV